MRVDSKVELHVLKVDGGMTVNKLLMQFQVSVTRHHAQITNPTSLTNHIHMDGCVTTSKLLLQFCLSATRHRSLGVSVDHIPALAQRCRYASSDSYFSKTSSPLTFRGSARCLLHIVPTSTAHRTY